MNDFDFGDAVWVESRIGCPLCCFFNETPMLCVKTCIKLHPNEDGHYIRPPAPPADKTTERPAAPPPDISYPMTNAELTDAIVKLGNMPTGSGYCSTWVSKKIADQIKFLLKAQRKRAVMMEVEKEGRK